MDYAETETCLTALPQIKQAAVELQGNIDQQLVAYIAVEPGGSTDTAELHDSLPAWLPPGKMPDVYVVLDGLPRRRDGELDRQVLSSAARGSHQTGSVSPRIVSGPAADVADIWREVLGREEIGLCDDLFDLGGHSLTITRIAVRIRSRMGIDVPLTVFYDTPTVCGIASAIEQARRCHVGGADARRRSLAE